MATDICPPCGGSGCNSQSGVILGSKRSTVITEISKINVFYTRFTYFKIS